jgi:hypothetical protein
MREMKDAAPAKCRTAIENTDSDSETAPGLRFPRDETKARARGERIAGHGDPLRTANSFAVTTAAR